MMRKFLFNLTDQLRNQFEDVEIAMEAFPSETTPLFGDSVGSTGLLEEPVRLGGIDRMLSWSYRVVSGTGGLVLNSARFIDSSLFTPGEGAIPATLKRVVVYGGALALTGYGLTYIPWFKARVATITEEFSEVVINRVIDKATLDQPLIRESARPGSVESDSTTPRAQGTIGNVVGSDFFAIGSVHRFIVNGENFLILPDHVLAAADNGDTEVQVKGQQGFKPLTYVQDDLLDLATDLIAIRVSENYCNQVGLPKAPIGALTERPAGQMVKIVGPAKRGTMGMLSHSALFGYTVYQATTLPGYSGAGYYEGARLLAIHLAGGKDNLGVSASYAYMRLKSTLKVEDEDSYEWLHRALRTGNVRINSNHYEGGVEIRHQGLYHVLTREAVDRALGPDWVIGNDYGRDHGYNDYDEFEEDYDRYDQDEDDWRNNRVSPSDRSFRRSGYESDESDWKYGEDYFSEADTSRRGRPSKVKRLQRQPKKRVAFEAAAPVFRQSPQRILKNPGDSEELGASAVVPSRTTMLSTKESKKLSKRSKKTQLIRDLKAQLQTIAGPRQVPKPRGTR